MKQKLKELRERESGALKTELSERQKHLFDLRSQSVTEKLEDPTQMAKTRRDIARIKTILRQRDLETKKQEPAKAVAAQA